MHEHFKQAKELIEKSQTILLTTHERTDGDDFGTISALAEYLTSRGKSITKVVKGGVPKSLRFLPTSHSTLEDVADERYDLLIVSGCSKKERIGNQKVIALNIPSINIDHHPDNTNYGTVNIVDHTKSSVAELTFDFFTYCNWPITGPVATCLLTGIFTDTGSFMHSNTAHSTLRTASLLMSKGAHTHTIAKHTYKGKGLETLKAWGKALDNAYFDSTKKIVYSIVTQEDLEELGNIPQAAFEGLVETLNKVPEAKFALFLKQDGQIIKGSLRSETHKGVNVNAIAKLFGGGGHTLASGFSIAGRLMKNSEGHWKVL